MDNTILFSELLKLLNEFDHICEKYQLTYYLYAGTLLGAIRHSGFIPWDDDLDIAMPREDYNRLLNISSKEFSYPYFLQTPSTDPGYNKSFVKLRKSDTTEIPIKDGIFNYNHGIFLDVFPLDPVPHSNILLNIKLSILRFWQRLLHYSARINGEIGLVGLDTKRIIFYFLVFPFVKTGLLSSSLIFKKINKYSSATFSFPFNDIGSIILTGKNKRFIYDKHWFSSICLADFEGKKYPVPLCYSEVLRNTYGDYMTPVNQPPEHGETLIDVNTPYIDFIEKNRDLIKSLYLKKED